VAFTQRSPSPRHWTAWFQPAGGEQTAPGTGGNKGSVQNRQRRKNPPGVVRDSPPEPSSATTVTPTEPLDRRSPEGRAVQQDQAESAVTPLKASPTGELQRFGAGEIDTRNSGSKRDSVPNRFADGQERATSRSAVEAGVTTGAASHLR
jgi:hypothetical protein